MNTVTLTKGDYQKLIKRQDEADDAITELQETVKVLSRDEVMPAVAKRLEHQSRLIDVGKGKRFRSMQSFRVYVRGL
jgi:hypothetical protein